MNSRLLLATISGAVVSFFMGWFLYGILLKSFMDAHTMQYIGLIKEMPNIFVIFFGSLFMAFLLAFVFLVFQRWMGFKTIIKGMTGGMTLAFFMSLSFYLYFIAMMNLYSFPALVTDFLVSAVIGALIGGITGWILGFEKKAVK